MKIFVYGSIKKGYWAHKYLEAGRAEFLGDGVLYGYRLYNIASFPAMVKSPDPIEKVLGEVYEVSSLTLEAIDAFENEGIIYRRELMTSFIGDTPTQIYTYIYIPIMPRDAEKVENNNWQVENNSWHR